MAAAVAPGAGKLHQVISQHAVQQGQDSHAAEKLASSSLQTRGNEGSRLAKVLAYLDDFPGVPAALQCPVGSGVAVLCATHPELAPHWLLPACSCQQQLPHASGADEVAGAEVHGPLPTGMSTLIWHLAVLTSDLISLIALCLHFALQDVAVKHGGLKPMTTKIQSQCLCSAHGREL